MPKKKTILFILCVIPILSFVAFAHPGRTDENGGHWDHKTGEYHFHTGEYAGRSSSGSSSSYKNDNFKPPYAPPTENPYRNKAKSSNSEHSVTDRIQSILSALFCIWVCISFIVYDFERTNGLFTLGILSVGAVTLFFVFISEYPFRTLTVATLSVVAVLLFFKIKRRYCSIEDDITRYKNDFIDLKTFEDEAKKAKAKIEETDCAQIPGPYEKMKQNIEETRNELAVLHKNCNTLRAKIFITFSRKNKKALQEANKNYEELFCPKQLSLFDVIQ